MPSPVRIVTVPETAVVVTPVQTGEQGPPGPPGPPGPGGVGVVVSPTEPIDPQVGLIWVQP